MNVVTDEYRYDESYHIVPLNKYGKEMQLRRYEYDLNRGGNEWYGGDESWGTINCYADDFADTLIYNNVTMDLCGQVYERNPMRDDGMVPAPEPEFPDIPNEDLFRLKHYYVLRDTEYLDQYYLYLLEYEPVSISVDGNGNVIAAHKYGEPIRTFSYTYTLGQRDKKWKRISTNSNVSYDRLTESHAYNNFEMVFDERSFEVHPIPDDGLIPAAELNFPQISNLDIFKYKHYYIVQDRKKLERYYLFLPEYEPVSMEVKADGKISWYQKYGREMSWKAYYCDIGGTAWRTSSGGGAGSASYYADFSGALKYNNFTIDYGYTHFEMNLWPGSQLVPAVEPQLPNIPYVNSTQCKHYYIFQDKTKLEKYFLYLYKYEPARVELDGSGNLTAYNRYGKKVSYNQYYFDLGQAGWNPFGSGSYLYDYAEDYRDALVHNNFALDTYDEYHGDNCLPDDQVVPASEPDFPAFPDVVSGDHYRYYVLTRDFVALDSYTLYLLQHEPVNARKGETWVEFAGENDRTIHMQKYRYTAGEETWKLRSSSADKLSEEEIGAIEYCNFDIVTSDSRSPRSATDEIQVPCNTYSRDGIGIGRVRNGWTKINQGWYYYVNGIKQFGWIGARQLRSGQMEQVSYCAKEFNGIRAENGMFRIDGSPYLFRVNGALVTGKDDFEEVTYGDITYLVYANGEIYGQNPVYVEGTAITDLPVFETFPYSCGGDFMGTIEKGTTVKVCVGKRNQCYYNSMRALFSLDMHYIKVEYGDKTGYVDISKLEPAALFNQNKDKIDYEPYVVKSGISEITSSPGGIRMVKLSQGDEVNAVKPKEVKSSGGISYRKVFYYNGLRWVPEEDIKPVETTEGSRQVYAIAESTSSSAFYNYMTRDKQEANALYIYYYLSDPKNGWKKEAIAGLLGNLQQECVMNPGAWQSMGSSGDGNVNQGYGLVQWTAAKDKFLKNAGLSNIQANNLAANDPQALMDLQLEYLLTTMKPGGGEWLSSEAFVKDHYNAYPLNAGTPRLMSYSDYISSTIDAGELALVFQAHYERSGDYKVEQTEHRLKTRHDYAQDWYTFFKNY